MKNNENKEREDEMNEHTRTDGTKVEYLTCAETAKLIRKALKEEFPKVKFSVRSSTYSGGASIRVNWIDGPLEKAVEAVAGAFAGATFDGMIDLKSHHDSEYEGRTVSFGADYVFCSRSESNYEALVAEATEIIERRCVVENGRFGNWPIEVHARSTVKNIDFSAGETVERGFERAVLRR